MIQEMKRWFMNFVEGWGRQRGITSHGVDAAYIRGDIASGSVTVGGAPLAAGPHDLVGSQHTATGLTAGHVLTALTATTFGFQVPATQRGSAWAPLTNGDPAAPALIWDSFGQVVMCEVLR